MKTKYKVNFEIRSIMTEKELKKMFTIVNNSFSKISNFKIKEIKK